MTDPNRARLAEIERLAAELQAPELAVAKARLRLQNAIRSAHAENVPQAEIARAAGVSRQRIGAMLVRLGKGAKRVKSAAGV